MATNAWAEDGLPEKTLLRVSRSRSGPGKAHVSTTCLQLLHKRGRVGWGLRWTWRCWLPPKNRKTLREAEQLNENASI